MRVIAHDFQNLRSVVAAVLDNTGVLLEANAGFMHLLGSSPARRIGANVALLFAQPAFTELAALRATEGGEIFSGKLSVVDSTGRTLELPGRVWRSAAGLCVLAEYDVESLGQPAHQRAAALPDREVRVVEAALTDKISGTGNREKLDSSLAVEITRVRRTGLPLSAMMGSVDQFAEITGEKGHQTGKKVLARFGYLLRLLTRPTDIPARFEGDEFVVLMPHTRVDQGLVVARRIRTALGTELVEPLQMPVAASFGVAQFQPGEDAPAFLARLKSALEKARKTGGDDGIVALV